jgi:predicted transcriptional regulator
MSDERAQSTGVERILLGILALLAADRDERVEGSNSRRTELILGDAGFSAREIARLLGKEHEAVRSTVRRASKKNAA